MQVKITRPTVIEGNIPAVGEVIDVTKGVGQFLIRTDKAVAIVEETAAEPSAENANQKPVETVQLADIKGISEARLEVLQHHGITTVQQLIDADPVDLAPNISGVGEATIKQWQAAAAEHLAASD